MKKFLLLVSVLICFSVSAQRGRRTPAITPPVEAPRVSDLDLPPTNTASPSELKHSKKSAPQPNNATNFRRVIRQMNILPLSDGILLSNANSDDENIYLHTESYDKNIENLWRNDFKISHKFDYVGEQTDSVFHYALFQNPNRKNQIFLLKTSIKTGIRKQIETAIPNGFRVHTFRVVREECFLACTYKEKPLVIIVDSKSSAFKILPNLLNRNAKFLTLGVDNQSFMVILKKITNGKLLIRRYDLSGKLLNSFDISEEKKHFNEAKIIEQNGKILLVGTYSKGLNYRLDGIYIAPIEANFRSTKIKYLSFSDFRSLGGKVAPFAISHDLRKTQNGVLGVVELFEANIINQDYAGKIKYDRSLIFKLDENGNLIWENSVSLDGLSNFIYASRLPFGLNLPTKTELLESSVKPMVRVLQDKNQIVLAYFAANMIQTNQFDVASGNKLSAGIYQATNTEIINGFLPWYENNFLLWGKEKREFNSPMSLFLRRIEAN